MKVQALNAYRQPYVNSASQAASTATTRKTTAGALQSESAAAPDRSWLENPQQIISKPERDFFVKLFPESGERIQNHVIFNRNGRLQPAYAAKGVLLDGLA
ncbi:MAG: hypothetical protein ACM3U1_02700 [Chloroflexota bacterium]